MQDNIFALLDGNVRVWIDQDAVHLIAGDPRYGDPCELTSQMALELASILSRCANSIDIPQD